MTLRLPDDLHARLREAAGRDHRSLNSEITHRLERSFECDLNGGTPIPPHG